VNEIVHPVALTLKKKDTENAFRNTIFHTCLVCCCRNTSSHKLLILPCVRYIVRMIMCRKTEEESSRSIPTKIRPEIWRETTKISQDQIKTDMFGVQTTWINSRAETDMWQWRQRLSEFCVIFWTEDLCSIQLQYHSQALKMSLLAILKEQHLECKYLLHFTE
jgi:hypothetical protein